MTNGAGISDRCTNIFIATLGNKLTSEGTSFIQTIPPDISVITQIELLEWHEVAAVT